MERLDLVLESISATMLPSPLSLVQDLVLCLPGFANGFKVKLSPGDIKVSEAMGRKGDDDYFVSDEYMLLTHEELHNQREMVGWGSSKSKIGSEQVGKLECGTAQYLRNCAHAVYLALSAWRATRATRIQADPSPVGYDAKGSQSIPDRTQTSASYGRDSHLRQRPGTLGSQDRASKLNQVNFRSTIKRKRCKHIQI